MTRVYYELKSEDIGKARIWCFGALRSLVCVLGRVLPLDVGKRVYLSSGVLQVETEEQRRFRMKRGHRP